MASYFTPSDQATLYSQDLDFGTGGLVLLPNNELITAGKEGTLYLLNSTNLGGYQQGPNGTDKVLSELSIGSSLKEPMAYFNGLVYVGGNGMPLQAFSISNDTLSLTAQSSCRPTPAAPFGPFAAVGQDVDGSGTNPTISANGTSNGIVWALDNSSYSYNNNGTIVEGGPAVLYAYNASNLQLLYSSTQAANSRDQAGVAVKFTAPVVANGLVYVGGEKSVTVYGELATAAPSNLAATAGNGQVTLSWTGSSGATSYNVYRWQTMARAAPLHSGVSGTSYTDSTAANGTTYFYEVTAVNSGGESGKSNEVSATPTATAFTQVNLTSSFNHLGIYADGAVFSNANSMDGGGASYSATLLGTSQTWNGIPFIIGAVGANNVITSTGQVIALPSGKYTNLDLLALAIGAPQVNQVFTVTYSDTTTDTFTQSLSDWASSNSYAGESIVVTMAYDTQGNGTIQSSTRYLYGYSFSLNAAKTVSSITLPNDANVKLLSVTLSTATSVPTAPSNLAATAGNGQVTLSWTGSSGATSYNVYRGTTSGQEALLHSGVSGTSYTDSTAANGTTYFYEVTAVNSGGESGKSNEVSATPTATAFTQVNLTSSFNHLGIYADGAVFSNANSMDGGGASYSATLLGTSQTWNGIPFIIGAVGANNVITSTGQVIALPSGKYTNLDLLALAIGAPQVNQVFTVTYSDTTTDTFTQSLSDWASSNSYAGESIVVTMAYDTQGNGTIQSSTRYLYGYSFSLNAAKTVSSITLPNDANVKLLSVTLSTATSVPTAPSNLAATAGNGQVTLSWTGSSGATSYNVYRGTTSGQEALLYSGVSGTSYTDSTAANGTTYFYEVTAVNSGGESGKSNEVSATPTATAFTQVNLTSSFNHLGIYADGAVFSNANSMDGGGASYSATLLGTSQTWNGIPFIIGAVGANNVITSTGQVIALPSGKYTNLDLLALAIGAPQVNQVFTVTYSDTTTDTFTQSLSDWASSNSYAGESIVVTMAYDTQGNGTIQSSTRYLYGYSFSLNAAKTVSSITLPNDANVKLLSVTLSTATSVPTAPSNLAATAGNGGHA